jgi:1,4-dihydroxy-2-naphthoate octaprenyltransferase
LTTSRLKIWAEAARPKTLAAGFIPVFVGASFAWADGNFHTAASLVALFCALLIQIGTNFANDYFDFKKGGDSPNRIGFTRAVAAGLISPETMLKATILTMGLAFVAGLYLVWIGGFVILAIGVLSLLFGILYTGGPYPLAYNGLGDLFVFIFFGIVAVMGTYYVNTLNWSEPALIASLAVGALCVNILVINNLRDVNEDRVTGKRTLGVIFGEKTLKIEYTVMLVLAFIIPVILWFHYSFSIYMLIPLLAIPFSIPLLKQVWFHTDKSTLNLTLERTARLMVLFGILFSTGILIA